jgi:hypothetical protein
MTSQEQAGPAFADFSAFLALFGVVTESGSVVRLAVPGDMPLYVGWVAGDLRFTEQSA